MPIETQDCCGSHGADILQVDEARQRIIDAMPIIDAVEQLALRTALGRVLAEDIDSSIDVPPYRNSAMDGYAILGSDIPADGNRALCIVGTALAGTPFEIRLQPGQCVRITTGAQMPVGADTVVMQEQVVRENNQLTISDRHVCGENVRQAGEDLARGDRVFSPGKTLTPADIGLLASMGVTEVRVRRRLRIAFFSTGDELRPVGETLEAGQLYDSNRYTLFAMLTRLGVELLDMGIIPDQAAAIEAGFRQAQDHADVLITSGGVSVGDSDFVKQTLERIGEVNFWKIAMKPGHPLTFGRLKNCHFFGLPGNPVSAMVTFYQFVQPALKQMMGQTELYAPTFRVPCASALHKAPGRVEFQRGILEHDAHGNLQVNSTGQQGSGILSSMVKANCFIVLPQEAATVAVGSLVTVQPFSGMI